MRVAEEFLVVVHKLHTLQEGEVRIFKKNGRLVGYQVVKRQLTEFEVAQDRKSVV